MNVRFLALIAFFIAVSCEKLPDNLKDPSATDKWTVYNSSTGLPGNQVRGVFCDSKSNMWFAVSSKGVAKYSNGTWTYYKTSNSGLQSDGVTCINEDNDGNILFGTVNGISILGTNNTWTNWHHPTLTLFITSIQTDNSGNIWFGTSGQGFFVYDGTQITQFNSEAFKTINDIAKDPNGNMWLGTDNGLLKYDGHNFTVLTMSDGLPDNVVTALFSDSHNRLWIGTYFCTTVSWLDNKGIHQQSIFNGNKALQMNDICEDARGTIWFSTFNSGLIEFDGIIPISHKKYNGLPEDDIIASSPDKDGNIWFGLYSKGLLKYSLPIN